MSKLSELLQVSDTERQAILKEYGITEEKFEENVDILWEWLIKTELPKNDLTRAKVKVYLLNCKMRLETTKRCIEGYYTVRTLYADFFDLMLPNTMEYNTMKKLAKVVVMPRLSADLCRITIFKITDPKGEARDGLLYQLIGLMITEIRLMAGDFFLSNILIIDIQEELLKNVVKYTPTVLQRLIHLLLAINIRIKNIHIVNTTDITDIIVKIFRSVLPPKFVNKLHAHKDIESLYVYIPKEYLPSNYKGDQPSIEHLFEKWCEELESREEYFQKLLQAKLTRDSVGNIKEYEIFGVGCEGSFRKLEID